MIVLRLVCLLLLGAVGALNKCSNESYGNVINPYPKPDPRSPDLFEITLETDVTDGDGNAMPPIVILVNRTLAPNGADRLHSLMRDKFFRNAAFFRVVPKFMIQFGIAADPQENKKWSSPLLDDKVLTSNVEGTVSFAAGGPNTRTTQIFINTADNQFLDEQGFSPFGKVTSGWNTLRHHVHNPTPGDAGGADQGQLASEGSAWLLAKYPRINSITCTSYGSIGASAFAAGAGESLQARDPQFVAFIRLFVVLFAVVAVLICFDADGRYYLSVCVEDEDRGVPLERKALLGGSRREVEAAAGGNNIA